MSSNNERTTLINNETTQSNSEKFCKIFEALLVLLFLPAAFGTYKLVHLVASDPPVWVLLTVLGFFVGLALVLVTPKQKWTTVTLGLELTGATVIFPGE